MARIYPSLISANMLNLQHEIQKLEPHVDGFHIDIMDNHFVDNLTWGSDMVNAIAKATNKTIWVHLMVDDPLSIIEKCSLPPQSLLTFHIESNGEVKKTISRIIEKNWLPGIAMRPKTAPDEIKSFLHDIHHVLPMSVEPGFSGQQFLPETIGIIQKLAEYKKQHNLEFVIAGDGGINAQNIKQLRENGVEDFAIASGIFSHDDPIVAIRELRKILQ